MVRLEALRGFASRGDDGACETFIAATLDVETTIALAAIDQMAGCGGHAPTVALLESAVNNLSGAGAPRGWHRSAHAIVALAAAAPAKAAEALAQFVASTRWQMRVYAARAAASAQRLVGSRSTRRRCSRQRRRGGGRRARHSRRARGRRAVHSDPVEEWLSRGPRGGARARPDDEDRRRRAGVEGGLDPADRREPGEFIRHPRGHRSHADATRRAAAGRQDHAATRRSRA